MTINIILYMPMNIYMAHENIYGPLKYIWPMKIYMAHENIYGPLKFIWLKIYMPTTI